MRLRSNRRKATIHICDWVPVRTWTLARPASSRARPPAQALEGERPDRCQPGRVLQHRRSREFSQPLAAITEIGILAAVEVVCGSDGVWTSRDFGATWQPTSGHPKHPQANHLDVVAYSSGCRVAYLGTWNWALWRAELN